MSVLNYDYSKLRGRIKEIFDTQEKFADAMGISKTTISYKLNGMVEWTQEEIERAVDILNIPWSEIHAYFFTRKVEKISS
jgi:transcriptional regulator with XRE-family HTH domain